MTGLAVVAGMAVVAWSTLVYIVGYADGFRKGSQLWRIK